MKASRYYVASVVLLVVLVAAYAVTAARRTERELTAQLEQKAFAIAAAVESASRQAIRSNALLEDLVAQRLLDDARLVDELNRQQPLDAAALARLATRNHLRRIELLDRDGRPWTPPPTPVPPGPGWRRGPGAGPDRPGWPGPMMHRPHGPDDAPPHEARRGEPPMMPFMWGRRWSRPPVADDGDTPPPAIRDRRFWEGSLFGVGIGARSFPGIIVVHADAEFVRDFRKDVGVERQLEELAREAGLVSVAVLAPDLTVLAHTDPARVGTAVGDSALRDAVTARRSLSRTVVADGARVFEVARPLAVDGDRPGLLLARFPTAPLERAWRAHARDAALLGGAVLVVGALGFGAIFYAQRRRLADVSRLEAEMARRERAAALGDVAAAFAHEVRNPLNAVSMGLQRLRTEWAPEPRAEYARFVDVLEGEARRLNTIVEQFIALARPVPLAPAPLAIGALLPELAVLLDAQARAAGVEVRVEDTTGGRALPADRDRLQQALLNLALNALHAMPEGGVLTLAASATREAGTLEVRDTGRGIPPDVLPRIFDPSFTTRPDGLGLGLPIARRIVEAHGGTIDVASEPGRGTRVRIALPWNRP